MLIRKATPMLLVFAVVGTLGGVAVHLTSEVNATARRLQLSNVSTLTKNMTEFVDHTLTLSAASIPSWERPAGEWTLRPGDPADQAAISRIATVLPEGCAGAPRRGERPSAGVRG